MSQAQRCAPVALGSGTATESHLTQELEASLSNTGLHLYVGGRNSIYSMLLLNLV